MDRPTQIKLSANTAIIAGVFSVLVSILLLINYTIRGNIAYSHRSVNFDVISYLNYMIFAHPGWLGSFAVIDGFENLQV